MAAHNGEDYFGVYFNKPIEGVVSSPTLQVLEFGQRFNMAIESLEWPCVLKIIALSRIPTGQRICKYSSSGENLISPSRMPFAQRS